MSSDITVYNPYIVGPPVDSSKVFYGRDDIFSSIRRRLIGKHRDNVIVLCGQSRTGKTSVLLQLRYRLDKRYLCVFIDLHDIELKDLGSFLWGITNSIVNRLQQDYKLTLSLPDRAMFMVEPGRFFVNEFLSQVWSMVGDHHILLMLDEATRLQEQGLEQRILEYMRSLMQHDRRLNFLFSFGNTPEEMKRKDAFLFNIGLHIKVSFLDQQSTYNLITEPVKDYYRFSPIALEQIFRITSGHPYYTQLLCHCLFNQWQDQHTLSPHSEDNANSPSNRQQFSRRESRSPIKDVHVRLLPLPEINVQHVNAVLDEAVELGELVLAYTWDDSTAGEKAIMAGMAAAMSDDKHPVNFDSINAYWLELHKIGIPSNERIKATRRLIARDIIANQDQYIFTVDLLWLWIKKHKRLEFVAEEIKETLILWISSHTTINHLPQNDKPNVISEEITDPVPEEESTNLFPETARKFKQLVFLRSLPFFSHLSKLHSKLRHIIFTSYFYQFKQIHYFSWPMHHHDAITQLLRRRKFIVTSLTGLGLAAIGSFIWLESQKPSQNAKQSWLPQGTTIQIYSDHSQSINAVTWSPDSKFIATGSNDRTVKVWEPTSGKTFATYNNNDLGGAIYAVAWALDNQRLAIGGDDHTTKIWSTISRSVLTTCIGHRNAVTTVAWSANDNYLVSGSKDHTMRIWDTRGIQLQEYDNHRDTISTVAWSPNGNFIASVGIDGTIELLDVKNHVTLLSYQDTSSPGAVYAVAWSPDSNHIVTAGNNLVNVWEWDTTSAWRTLTCEGHVGSVYTVAWSPDGKYIASCGSDKTVKIWDSITGHEVFTYRDHHDQVFGLAWSPDSKYIASAGGDKDPTVRVWRAIN